MNLLVEVSPPYGEPFSELRDALIDLGVSFREMQVNETVYYIATVNREQLRVLRSIAEDTGGCVSVISETMEVKA
ncbi:MAG: hypothetical protein HY544_01460 [Candidatus Diapherotrites archaeon]|uniref:Uncharacterized protein n=1 Tax=Candidatus Iainarchaeum sp. TaxID=3101447 RepID=A0A8T3YPR1_9ARCH|nr:hypothetical protein [Candidatus Diapherotrites archaeon]